MNDEMEHTVSESAEDASARLRELVEEVIGGSPIFLIDVQVRGNRGSRVVEIFVDSDEDLGVDELARISREVEFLLDLEELIAGRYSLNVSSPGLDKPLSVPRQYKKNIGRELRVHYRKQDGSGNTEVEGTVRHATDEAIDIERAENDLVHIPLDDIIWAKVQLPW